VILDTNAVSALFAGDPGLDRLLAGAERHHLPVIVLGEYRYGLSRSKQRTRLGGLLDVLARESILLRVDERTAESYALVREELRRAGTPIPENDVWIAALALQHGEPVVSRDAHFDRVAGVEWVSW
jgi:tRNA(fMet)-specific endonuclease VapC